MVYQTGLKLCPFDAFYKSIKYANITHCNILYLHFYSVLGVLGFSNPYFDFYFSPKYSIPIWSL